MDFRTSTTEMLLLDSGAEVNIVGEDITKDIGVKVYKLKEEARSTALVNTYTNYTKPNLLVIKHGGRMKVRDSNMCWRDMGHLIQEEMIKNKN